MSPHFVSGLHFLEDFVQILDKTPEDISVIASKRLMPDLLGLVNNAYEAFCQAQSKINGINNEMDNELQNVVVKEKFANDQLIQIQERLQKQVEHFTILLADARELEQQLCKERFNLEKDISFAQEKEAKLEQAKRAGTRNRVLGAALGGIIGFLIADSISDTDVANAKQAVSEASARVTNTEKRLFDKKNELSHLEEELEKEKEKQRRSSQQLKMLAKYKEATKISQKRLARWNELIKNCTTFVDTTTTRAKMMADEANGELPDIEAMLSPLRAIAGDLSQVSLSNSSLLSGSVDIKAIGFKIKTISSKAIKSIAPGDIDQWV